jgi:hypothetical protein
MDDALSYCRTKNVEIRQMRLAVFSISLLGLFGSFDASLAEAAAYYTFRCNR